MRVTIPYGKGEVSFEVPKSNLVGVFSPKITRGVGDEQRAVRNALLNPIGCEPLPRMAKGRKRVVVIVTDFSRPTKDHVIVPPILDALSEAGIEEEKIKIIIGSGQHRKMTDKEVEQKLGQTVLNRVTVEQHDPDSNLVDLGVTKKGNRILLNREVADADLKISTSNIVPHRYAGFGGGSKSILPGVCGRQAIYQNHLYVVEGKCKPGVIEGNPIRDEMNEVASIAGLDFIVNTVMNPEKQIVNVFGGHFLKAHAEGAKYAISMLGAKVPSKVEVVVSSGSPMDVSFYQASKAMEMGDRVVSDGGTFILTSPCYEGIGDTELYEFLTLRSPEEILERLKAPRPGTNLVCGVVSYLIARMRKRVRVVLVSDGLRREEVEAMGFEKADSVEAAVKESLETSGRDSRVAVFPQGPVTFAML